GFRPSYSAGAAPPGAAAAVRFGPTVASILPVAPVGSGACPTQDGAGSDAHTGAGPGTGCGAGPRPRPQGPAAAEEGVPPGGCASEAQPRDQPRSAHH